MLTQVRDYDSLRDRMGALLKAGVRVNSLPDGALLQKEIASGSLFALEGAFGLLLLRRRPGFDRLSYLLCRDAEVPDFCPDRTTVLEIPYRLQDEITAEISGQWGRRGFECALTRVRLTRKPGLPTDDCPEVRAACPEEAEQVAAVLAGCFSPLTACLPDEDALADDLAEGRFLSRRGGLLHYSVSGRTAEIRHLGVLPEYRRQGIARSLVNAFLLRQGGGLCRVWTGKENTSALNLYRGCGFREDGWISDVRIFGKDMML